MATIGSLAVNIVATTDKFVTGLNKAQSGLGRFVSTVGATTTALAGLGAYGFASVVKGAVDAGGELFDLSNKLNITTEALSALDYAANNLGVSTDVMHGALSKMTRKLGEAANGAKAAVAAFQSLGIDFRTLMGIPVDQQFLAIVNAINNLPGAEKQAAAAAAIFGKSAAELNAIIKAGSEELVRFGDEAARSGAIVSTETAAALDDASDSINNMNTTWGALKLNLVGTFAPAITAAMWGINKAMHAVRATFHAVQTAILFGMENVVRGVNMAINAINVLLPKSMEVSTQFTQQLQESLAIARKAAGGKWVQDVQAATGMGGATGPLKTPAAAPAAQAQPEVAKNTAKMVNLLEQQNTLLFNQNMRDRLRGDTGAQLAALGMR